VGDSKGTLNKPLTKNLIAYRWALDETGRPIPISQAQRGYRYYCPLCHGQMIPRLGEQLQHHFGHEEDTGCTPEAVTRAAVRRWIAIQLREALNNRQVIKVEWLCSKCGNHHSADLLGGAAYIYEGYLWDAVHYADIAMVDTAGNVNAVILVQDEELPTADTLQFFTAKPIYTLIIPASVTPAESDFVTLVSQGQIAGAPCPMLQQATNIIQEPEVIRKALRDVVSRWPGYFYGELETVNGLSNVLRIGNEALWLSPEQWREIVGGTRNPLAPDVQVTMQTWPHSDGGTIWLYYATVRGTAAVGIKRYGPGATPMPSLDHRFRQRNIMALHIVYYLVMQ